MSPELASYLIVGELLVLLFCTRGLGAAYLRECQRTAHLKMRWYYLAVALLVIAWPFAVLSAIRRIIR